VGVSVPLAPSVFWLLDRRRNHCRLYHWLSSDIVVSHPRTLKPLAIVGPTASGKTTLGLQTAREQAGEIISVDSRQVYRLLAIGTAKPQGTWTVDGSRTTYVVQGVPYHLVDIWDPDQPFTAADFVLLAREKIEQIRQRGKRPILVGGTGLYLKALTEGLAPLPPRDESLREELLAVAEKKGRPYLHAELTKVDSAAAKAIPANNIQRVLRALEVYRLTGKPISQWHREHQSEKPKHTPAEIIRLDPPREELHRRIVARCETMLEQGMIEETRTVLKRYKPNCPALTGLGYPRVLDYLNEKISRKQLLELLIQDTRQYAKRQRTWFKHQLK
jgi:tRNA dimethylallyltransferase